MAGSAAPSAPWASRWLVRGGRLRDGPVEGATVDVRVHGDQIVEVGPDLVGAGESVVEAAGRVILPGLRDAHVHFTTWALDRRTANLNAALAGATSPVDAAGSVVEHRGTDRTSWLRGSGFRQSTWSTPPDKTLLDAAAPDRPVVLVSQDVHSSWWSSAALAAVGLADHPDGYLREHASWDALARIPTRPDTEVDAAVADAVAAVVARGITSIVDYEFEDGAIGWRRRSDTHGGLDLRVASAVMRDGLDEAIAAGWRTGSTIDRAGRVRVGGLKLFTDGALGSRTAWCDHHYAGEPDNHGMPLLQPEELAATIQRAARHGLDVNVHAIGDAANRVVLDAFAATGVRGTVEHAQLLDPADLARIGSLTAAVSVQPSHAVDDRDLAERWWADRLDRAYPLRALLDAGARPRFGSDAPVAPMDPWRTIAAAVARTLDDLPPWLPEQAVDLGTAISCSTASTVEPGQPADLILLEDDPATLAAVDLANVGVHATMCAGRWTHGPDRGRAPARPDQEAS